MASHEVIVQSSDRTTRIAFSPTSVAAQPGDTITFVSKHQGRQRPGSISVQFTSGNVCDASGSRSVSELQLELNGSGRVQVCPGATAGSVSYHAGTSSGGTSLQSSPELIFDDE